MLTSVSNKEEKEAEMDKVVPFLLQDELEKKGEVFKRVANGQINVQAD